MGSYGLVKWVHKLKIYFWNFLCLPWVSQWFHFFWREFLKFYFLTPSIENYILCHLHLCFLPYPLLLNSLFYFKNSEFSGLPNFSNETCDISTYPYYVFSDPWTFYTATKGIFITGGFTVIIIYDEWKVHSLRTQRENSILASG